MNITLRNSYELSDIVDKYVKQNVLHCTHFDKLQDVAIEQLIQGRTDNTMLMSSNRQMLAPIVACCRELRFNIRIIEQLHPSTLIFKIQDGYLKVYLPTSYNETVLYDPHILARYVPTDNFDKISSTSATCIYEAAKKVCITNKDEHLLFNLLRYVDMTSEEIRELNEQFGRAM